MGRIMTALKSFVLAFSMYSRIPMPHVRLEEKDMKYIFGLFPLVGAVIGALASGWLLLADRLGTGTITAVCAEIGILLLITGGIHTDGYMDTMDAVHSYGDRQKKLEILKDSHIGAFAVIMLLVYIMFEAAALAQIYETKNLKYIILTGFVFYLSRIASAAAAVNFKAAKSDGMLRLAASGADKRTVNVMLCFHFAVCMAGMAAVKPAAGAVLVFVQLAVFIYYRLWSYKSFGGVTGDLAGWFLCVSELCQIIVLAVMCL